MTKKKVVPEVEDFAARYTALQGAAAAVNHEVRLMVLPGKAKEGQEIRLGLLIDPTADLATNMKAIEEYLATPAAASRGRTAKAISDAQQAEEDARVAYDSAVRWTDSMRRIAQREDNRYLAAKAKDAEETVEIEMTAEEAENFLETYAPRKALNLKA